MSRRRHTPEQIITALREAEVGMVSRELGISEQTYYRWRQEFGVRVPGGALVTPTTHPPVHSHRTIVNL